MTEGRKVLVSMDPKDDTRPFPIQQGDPVRDEVRRLVYPSSSLISWWLAEEAYKSSAKLYGSGQSLERLAERGGFGRKEQLFLLRQSDHSDAC